MQQGKIGLSLQKIHIALHGRTLLEIDTTISPGTVLTIMGPSGSGKSSLLACLAGFLAPDFEASGSIWLNGEEITHLPTEARHMGLLFQDPLLFPHMSVGENLLFALPATVKGRKTREEKMCMALKDISMADCEARDPATLSGGQKARVALARTLLSAPRALLLDEPFSKLDAALRDQMRTLVFDRAHTLGLPCLLVTHDEADAQAAGGPIIRL